MNLCPPHLWTRFCSCYFVVIFLLSHLEGQEAGLRQWTSTTGTKMEAKLSQFANGKVTLANAAGKTVNVPVNAFVEADLLHIKSALESQMAEHILTPKLATTGSTWPEILYVDPQDAEIQAGTADGDWPHVWTSGHFRYHAQRDFPAQVRKDLALLAESTLLSIELVSPELLKRSSDGDATHWNIHFFDDVETLKEATKLSSPGRSNKLSSVTCVDGMLGITTQDGEISFDTAAANRYFRMELFELLARESGCDDLPMWLYYGFRRLVSRIPQRGRAVFPAAAFAEWREEFNREAAQKWLAAVPSIDYDQWMDSSEKDRKGVSEPTYRRQLRKASFFATGYYRLLQPEGKVWANKIMTTAKGGADEAAINQVALPSGKAPEWSELSRAYQEYEKERWQSLSAATIRRPRMWTNQAGKSLSAELRGFHTDGKITLQSDNGREFQIPIQAFSIRDQAYVLANVKKAIDYESILASVGESTVTTKNMWPSSLSFPRKGISQARFQKDESSEGKYIYTTKNFHFTLHGRHPITELQMEGLARLFEATRELLAKSPFGIQASPVDGYYRAHLYDTEQGYKLAGGPPMSSGVYMRSKKAFMMPVERGSVRESDELDTMGQKIMTIEFSKDTLVHEITHMMMHDILRRLPIFFIEGSAEYVDHMPRYTHEFRHSAMVGAIVTDAKNRERWRRGWIEAGKTVPGVHSFEQLLTMTRSQWFDYIDGDNFRQSSLYFSSFLLVSYFMQNEPELVIKMLNACRKDAPGIKVYNFERDKYDTAVKAFKKLPGVDVGEDGYYTYSSYLPHPERPKELTDEKDADLAYIQILLNGRSADQVADSARAWLRENSIRY